MTTQDAKTLDELDNYEDDFFSDEYAQEDQEEDARAGATIPAFYWLNRRIDEETREETHTGWHAKRGLFPDFDEAMQVVVEAGQAELVRVIHNNKDDTETVQEYWHLTHGARVFILSRGLQSPWQMNKKPEENVGIAYGWPYDKEKEKGVANLKFQAILLPLYKAGYTQPVTFGVKRSWVYSRHNITIFDVLNAHQRVVDTANALLKSRNKPATVKFRHIALDLLQAPKWEWRGKPGTNDKKQCFAIVTNIPKAPEPIEDKFVISRYCGGELRELIEALLPDAIEWSKTLGVIWRDGALEDTSSSNGNGAHRERLEDFDPFAGEEVDTGEPDEEEQALSSEPQIARRTQRETMRSFADRYAQYGDNASAKALRLLSNRTDLTDIRAAEAIQKASKETYELKKAQDAAGGVDFKKLHEKQAAAAQSGKK